MSKPTRLDYCQYLLNTPMDTWYATKSVMLHIESLEYEVKHGMFAEYLRQELKTPSIKMDFA